MPGPPQNIRAHHPEKLLELVWEDDQSSKLPYRLLRGRCPCASCVNEFSGKRTFDIEHTTDEIKPNELMLSGNYALQIRWNDGHHTGIYTWDYLRSISAEWEAMSEEPTTEDT